MFQRLLDLSRTIPQRELWERINQGVPAEYKWGVNGRPPSGLGPTRGRVGAEAGGMS